MFDELLTSLEEVTGWLLERSRRLDAMGNLDEQIRQRALLIRQLAGEIASGRFVAEAERERLSGVHRQGELINANLLEARTRVADEINRGGRERLFADRLASQIPAIGDRKRTG